mmetsp:Transcript_138248/g.385652  ORF Transcript_138248/g.385652 Transcript_138248/m.385652 type:complete len:469 (-) Transcript_138248:170-1576(-)
MEKIILGWHMSNTWADPPIMIMAGTLGFMASSFLTVTAALGLTVGSLVTSSSMIGLKVVLVLNILVIMTLYLWHQYSYMEDGPAPVDDYVEFKDAATQRQWTGKRIPIMKLYELYLGDKVAFKMDLLEVLRDHRNEFVNYKITLEMIWFLTLQFFPNRGNSSMKHLAATKKEIAEHYDRGNDWFASFLGPRMVYTSAVFEGLDQSLEAAQDNKMSLLCDKLMLQRDETILDIGCGWGSLLCHAAKKYGAKALGVTLSVEGAKYCREKARDEGLEDQVDVLCMDYREMPTEMKFDKVVSVEMAEHVGLKNFPIYLQNIKDMMKDDGLFCMQVAGLRQGVNWEDISWGLFMSRYIFPGADASTPLNWYIAQMERAGFEVHSVETIGRHYSHTLHRWYDNFQRNRPEMERVYGSYLCRLWDFFLAWSVVAAGVGCAACYQILAHKNTQGFPRDVFCSRKVAQISVGLVGRK